MEYARSMGLACGGHIYVEWKTDEDGKIISFVLKATTAALAFGF
jgi:hypothetical protein